MENSQLPLEIDKGEGSSTLVKSPSLIWRILMKIRFLPLVIVFGAFFGVVALYFQPPGIKFLMSVLNLEPGAGTSSPIAVPAKPRPKPDESQKNKPVTPQYIIGLGILLPEGDIRNVAPPFGAGDARIAILFVDEGERVKVGDKLANLDNEENLRAIIQNAKSTVSLRKATLAQTRNSILISQQEAEASLARAKSALKNAQREFERTQKLFDRGFTTNSILDGKLATRDQAQGEVDRLQATLARFAANSIDEQPDVVVAKRNLEAAQSDLERAKGDLSKSRVVAPISGTVLNIYAHPGERPGAKGIMDIGNIAKMTADIEIYQTDIAKLSLGAKVTLSAEALATELRGKITKIGLEVGRQKLIDSDPAANTDARVITVTVTLDEASSAAAKNYTNLQVLSRIEVAGND